MVGLEEVHGKQRTNLGKLAELPQSERFVRGGGLVSPESTSSPQVKGISPTWQRGQPVITWASR